MQIYADIREAALQETASCTISMKNIHKFETGTLIDLRQVMGISMLQFSTVIQGGSDTHPKQAFALLYMEGGPQRVDLLPDSGIKAMQPSEQTSAASEYRSRASIAYEQLVNQWLEVISPDDLKQLRQTRIVEAKPQPAKPIAPLDPVKGLTITDKAETGPVGEQ